MWWLFVLYVVAIVLVVFLSNKVANYTDIIEKRTKLSGALLGGIVLAGITSLPELVTGITSSLLGEPELVQGDIFGSNVFDVCIIGVLMICFLRVVQKTKVSRDNAKFVLYCMLIAFSCDETDIDVIKKFTQDMLDSKLISKKRRLQPGETRKLKLTFNERRSKYV